MTASLCHGDFGYKYKVGDILVHVADWRDVITVMQRFIDPDTNVSYYWIRDEERVCREILTAYDVERNYIPAP
jgi:hypothetical protein